jgi:nucleoside-diphosphate-sugar epimerase
VTVREVLVTGATGFVGSHVAEALSDRGLRVRAVVRATSDTSVLKRLGIEPVVVSLEDEARLVEAISGADAVVHLAALTHARTEAELQRVNRDGTGSVVRAVARASEQGQAGSGGASRRKLRFVYLSSLAASGPSNGRPVSETDVPHPLTAYGRSKLAGEQVVKHHASSMEAVTLRAPAVYGPGDRELLRFFRMAKLGVMTIPAGPDRPLQFVHVKDLARGIVMAALQDGLEGTYNIADATAYAFRDVCRMIGRAVGRTPTFLPVPGGAISVAAGISETFSRLSGRSTMFNREKVREVLAPGWLCETQNARDAFGFTAQIPLEAGLRGTAEWYRTKGWL